MNEKFLQLEEERRDRILNAALREFSQKGFLDASVNQIIKEAAISKGLLFHYFASKQELFLFLCDYSLRMLQTELVDLINTEERDLLQRYRQIALLKRDLMGKHPDVFGFVKVMADTDAAEVKTELQARQQALLDVSLHRLFENIDLGRFKPGVDVRRALDIIGWSVEGFALRAQAELKGLPLAELDYDRFLREFDAYLELLQQCFYR